MKKRIEVRSQAEFDACVKLGNIAIVIGCRVEARGNSSVVARENSSVVAWENSSVEAWENSSVEAWGNSSVVAWGNSSVVARGNSSVVAWGNVFVRLFSASKIKASAHVAIVMHGTAKEIEGGKQMQAAPEPGPDATGAEYCEFNGLDPATAPYIVPNIDAAILAALESEKSRGLDMSGWHGDDCNETNWCETTHCRAGFAICLAGKAGFDLERKFGAETAGRMIYAVSRTDKPLPDFFADDETALEDIRASAATV
jgi:hypothetical protein